MPELDIGADAPLPMNLDWAETLPLIKRLGKTMNMFWPQPEGILAVARGGLVPATIIAHEHNIRKVVSVTMQSYIEGSVQPSELQCVAWPTKPGRFAPDEDNPPVLASAGAGWWVVDDILDTGHTFNWLHKRLPAAVFGTIFSKRPQDSNPFLYTRPIEPNVWVRFPWEKEKEKANG